MRSNVHKTLARSKGQGHKAMQRSSTKTSNISRKRHSVVEIHLSYRKSRQLRRMTGSDVWTEVPKQSFLRMRSENAENSLIVLLNRHNFSPFIRNRGRWTRRCGQFLDRKQNWRYFWACALKKSPKHSENAFRQKSYSPVTGNRGRRSEWRGQIFDRKLVNTLFCACTVKTKPKTRLLCCQIATILAPLWAITVADHDGI